MNDDSTAPGEDFSIPADPDVIDGDDDDRDQSAIGGWVGTENEVPGQEGMEVSE